tara:strand:- start:372 stop:857 length:486 start_codon:yes stop_codon:yes gene_type:complete
MNNNLTKTEKLLLKIEKAENELDLRLNGDYLDENKNPKKIKSSLLKQFTRDERTKLFSKLRDLKFQLAKKSIICRLSGDEKYYFADQCLKFETYIKENGYKNFKRDEISSVWFDTHQIEFSSLWGGGTNITIKHFKTKQEMLGFVMGFNDGVKAASKGGSK